MRTSTIIWSVSRTLAYELVCVLHQDWRAISHESHVRRAAKTISGCVAAAIGIVLAINMIFAAPWYESQNRHPGHYVVNGLHIAVPENLRSYPIEQLLPLP